MNHQGQTKNNYKHHDTISCPATVTGDAWVPNNITENVKQIKNKKKTHKKKNKTKNKTKQKHQLNPIGPSNSYGRNQLELKVLKVCAELDSRQCGHNFILFSTAFL